MLHTTLQVELPSEPYPATGRLRGWLRWVLVGPSPTDGHTHLVLNALATLERVLLAFAEAGFDDVIAVLVDRRPVYIDTQERLDDLPLALQRTVECGALAKGVQGVQLVLSRRVDESPQLHHLAEVTLCDDVLEGEPQLRIRWSTRVVGLRVARDEDGPTYAQRIAASLADGALTQARGSTTAAVSALRDALTTHLSPVRIEAPELRTAVVVPGPKQVGRFRHLGFGTRLRPRVYRPQPKDKRVGAYDDPHVYYYFDPYHDLLSWLMVDEALAGRWRDPAVEFVSPDGTALFAGGEAPPPTFEVPRDAVTIERDRLVVAESLPAMGFDPAEVGSPHAPGWGGDAS